MDLKQLKELAEKATPGPWINRPRGIVQSKLVNRIIFWDDEPNKGDKDEDILPTYQYIAAASPDVILELIKRIEELEEEIRTFHDGEAISRTGDV